jgi:ubiquinone/menaquinone biosynthesis C-methylase UbiE
MSQILLPDRLSLLRDPTTGSALTLVSEGRRRFLENEDGHRYPIRKGIPVFVEPDDLTGSDRKFRKFYNIIAPIYDLMMRLYFRIRRIGTDADMRHDFLGSVDAQAGDRVLEVSIGTGLNALFLPDCEFHGIDVSWGMIKRARKRCIKSGLAYQLNVADGHYLPYADNSFDRVFHLGGIKFFRDKELAIAEMMRVAKPGATIVIGDPTEKTMRDVHTTPLARSFFKGIKNLSTAPIDLLPDVAEDIEHREFLDGRFYCLRFRKPAAVDEVIKVAG